MVAPAAVKRYENNLSATHVESTMKEFSDAGSTPAASTNNHDYFFKMIIHKGITI